MTRSGPERLMVVDDDPRIRELLRRYLRAERVYWYVLWGGDAGPDTDFSLIKSPASYPNYWKSPLLTLLTTGR